MLAVDVSAQLMDWISLYGPAAIAGLLFLAAMGLPSPASLTVIFAGALVRLDALDPWTAVLYALAGTVAGDALAYSLARFAGGLRPAAARSGSGAAARVWQQAQNIIDRFGGAGIYLTRWLITPPALAVTLLVGAGRFSFPKFLLYDAAGELTWILVYGGLGYAFGAQWEQAAALLSAWSLPALALAAAGVMLAASLGVFGRRLAAVKARMPLR